MKVAIYCNRCDAECGPRRAIRPSNMRGIATTGSVRWRRSAARPGPIGWASTTSCLTITHMRKIWSPSCARFTTIFAVPLFWFGTACLRIAQQCGTCMKRALIGYKSNGFLRMLQISTPWKTCGRSQSTELLPISFPMISNNFTKSWIEYWIHTDMNRTGFIRFSMPLTYRNSLHFHYPSDSQ